MLSILIPTYNYDCTELVFELNRQCVNQSIDFEILVIDDGSRLFQSQNQAINSLAFSSYEILPENVGRSRVRNLLAQKAKFENLLFLDSDVMPTSTEFIGNYLGEIGGEKVISGGLTYDQKKPATQFMLRWKYGHQREARSVEVRSGIPHQALLSSNFMISKSVMQRVPFNENLPNLRREDTLFSYDLMKRKIEVVHIDNPVMHLGVDSFEVTIQKEHESLTGLKYIYDHQLIADDYFKLLELYSVLRKRRLTSAFAFLFRKFRSKMLKNLASDNPSLKIFDLYRIGFLCQISQNET